MSGQIIYLTTTIPYVNGRPHLGHALEIVQGDVDVWTFTATAGERIAVHIGEMTDTDGFTPWIRLWSPATSRSSSSSFPKKA